MKSVFFLAALAAPLIALAEPGDSALAEVVRRQPGPHLLARSGIATSSISKECQSQCSPIITTLDVCTAFFPHPPGPGAQLFIFFWYRRLARALLHANAPKRTLILSGLA